MDWLIPSIIATLAGTLVLVLVYEFLYRQDRELYLRTWMWGWLVYALQYVFVLARLRYHQTPALYLGIQLSLFLSSIFLLWGTSQFTERAVPRAWWRGGLAAIGSMGVTALLGLPLMVVTLPIDIFDIMVYFWAGRAFLRKAPHRRSVYQFTGWTFILWGLHKMDYPVLRPIRWFAPWGYLLAAVLELLAALGILLVHFDRMRRELIDSQATLAAFASALPDLGLIINHEGVYVDVITSQDHLLVASADVLRGSRMQDVLPREVADTIQTAVRAVLRTGQYQVIEYKLEVTAGQRWFEGHLSLMRRTGPDQGEVVLIARDITERKEWAEVLRQSNAELRALHLQVQDYAQTLEQRVKERTAVLHETNRHLQQLARTKDEFVSNVSHELRSPITSLKLRHYLLVRHPDQLDEHLPVIERETVRLEHTIEDLLTLSRMDQGRMKLNTGAVDLNALAEVYYFDRMPMAREQGLTLHLQCAPDLPLVQADDGLLSQVVDILLTNAVNYTPPGGDITLSTQVARADGQCWAALQVSDTGLGIKPEELAHLFDRFYRGQAAQQSKAAGTGLGLSIARAIVDQHGGRIDISSEGIPGEGATFTVWLPSDEGSSSPVPAQERRGDAQKGADAGRVGTSAPEVGEMEARSLSGHAPE